MKEELNGEVKDEAEGLVEWLEKIMNLSLISLGESKLTIRLTLTLSISFVV